LLLAAAAVAVVEDRLFLKLAAVAVAVLLSTELFL
jgi:hypothetical protein